MRGRGDPSIAKPLPLVHYSEKPITALGSVRQLQESDGVEANYLRKPSGLWFAEEGEWQASAGGWRGPQAFKHRYEVSLEDDIDLIRLETPDQFHEFAGLFTETTSYRDCDFVRWYDVARLADGIHVAVNVYKAIDFGRTGWLWGWDIASGCIWNVEKIVLTDTADGRAVPRVDVHEMWPFVQRRAA